MKRSSRTGSGPDHWIHGCTTVEGSDTHAVRGLPSKAEEARLIGMPSNRLVPSKRQSRGIPTRSSIRWSGAPGPTLARPPMSNMRATGRVTRRRMPGSGSTASTAFWAWASVTLLPAWNGKSAVVRCSTTSTALCPRSSPRVCAVRRVGRRSDSWVRTPGICTSSSPPPPVNGPGPIWSTRRLRVRSTAWTGIVIQPGPVLTERSGPPLIVTPRRTG